EWAFRRSHHEARGWLELRDLVRVGQAPSEEVRHERDARADPERWEILPLDALDVDVPARRVVRVDRVFRDPSRGTVDHDFGQHVDGHGLSSNMTLCRCYA